jgi:hypothetical protein
MKKRIVFFGGKRIQVPQGINLEVLLHASRTVVTMHPEDDTVTIRLPRHVARAMFAAAAERAFGESGRMRAVREYRNAEVMSNHAIGLVERERQLRIPPAAAQQQEDEAAPAEGEFARGT